MTVLEIKGLRAGVEGREILNGIDLVVRSGEVHAVMGPNGAGKSTLSGVILGRPGYEVLGGSVTLDGEDVLAMTTPERALAGLHLVMQYPTEVPGVRLVDAMVEAFVARGRDASDVARLLGDEAATIGFDEKLLVRSLNVDFSGGEKKRNETLQLAALVPKVAILDELDSGLDIDALRACARRIEALTEPHPDGLGDTVDGVGVLAITHYARLLAELRPDAVHILVKGRMVAQGGPELADVLEADGYAAFAADADEAEAAPARAPRDLGTLDDLFAPPS
ncbi:MAG: Fe-S cluster assembly ATPase SufC [Ilumatobacteraceae bacterium]